MLELLRGERDIVRIGHRGAAALAPENSLAAIEAAAAHGVDAVELDVLPRGDGEVVLAHGPELVAGAALLDDGLALAARLGLAVQLDVKLPGLERRVVEALAGSDLLERSFVSSPSLEALAGFAAHAPALPRAFTYPDDRFNVAERPLLRPLVRPGLAVMRRRLPRWIAERLREVGARAATLNAAVVTRAAVEACHELGAAVYIWTVNDPGTVRALVETGVDGIITDDPRILSAGSSTW